MICIQSSQFVKKLSYQQTKIINLELSDIKVLMHQTHR